jgi:hypothetical protein
LDNVQIGQLEYEFPELKGDPLDLNWIGAEKKYPGLGEILIKRFISEIGPGKIVSGSIIHDGTVNWLARNGFFNGVSSDFSRTFTNPTTLKRLPFNRLLARSGASLLYLTTGYSAEAQSENFDFPYFVRFQAITKTISG